MKAVEGIEMELWRYQQVKTVKFVRLFSAPSKNAGRQGDDGLQQLEYSIHRNPDQSEGK